MGQETVYCVRCASRIVGHDFERAKAYRIDGKAICAACLSPVEKNNISSSTAVAKKSSTRVRAIKPGLGTSTKLPQVHGNPAAPSKTPLIVAAIAGVVVLAAGVFWMRSGSPPPEKEEIVDRKPAPKAPAPPPLEKKKPEDPQIAAAREAIEAARATSKSDLEAQRSAWEEAARKAALTPLFKEASAGLQEIKDKLAAVKPPEPPKPLDKPEPPPPPKPTVEAGVSPALWLAAMTMASGGDFDGAAGQLRKESAGSAEADLLVQAGASLVQSRGEVSALAAGTRIALNYRGDSGERKRVEGTLLRAGRARFEIQQGEETVFVEISDICAESLIALVKPSQPMWRRYALLCILEGESGAARRLAGEDGFPSRYWDYARDAASKVPKVPSHELEARRLFYAAEKEYAKTETLASAIAKYRSLGENFADTAVVKSEPVRIKQRGEAGKEYFFAMSALKGTGTFALVPAARTEFAWVSKADVEGSQAIENYVEAEFSALPDVSYKCWALLGGCCGEVFACYLQTTEGTELNPKTRQRGPIDPGAAMAAPVKNRISGLKKTHEEHKIKGSKTHPKTPARWEWVEIPLPKYAGAGPKKIRLLSDQQGFGVAIIVVSATKSGPPADADFKEDLAQLKASVPPPPETKPWRALFDGKTKESVLRGAAVGWKVEDGKIVGVAGINDAAQTHEEFKDGEIRIRFEAEGLERLWFKLRQGVGGYSVSMDANLKAMDGKHELIYTAFGDKVTATLDGKPVPVVTEGAATMGCLQFNGMGKRFAVLSLDARP